MALFIVVALAPLWLVGIFGRNLWTPDEPREADIAWRMSLQQERAIPQLAGTPFLEKPPLTYWLSAGALTLWGDNAAALRAPNLLYALITALAVGALALAVAADARAALIAALIAGSALTAWRVSIWLAPDACLLAGCALSLLGAWRGYCAPRGRAKAAGYTLMHLGAAVGFMAKSAPGWLVPALALIALIVWERRFSELRRWELYVGLLLQALIIGPWLAAVAESSHGMQALRVLFWNNLAGRFTHVAAPAALDYTSGHRNFPGKYLIELPLYLLPWTLIVAAALVRALRAARAPGAGGSAWRYALCASLPFLALLSVAATARDIYAAPALLGFALLTGLWVREARAPLGGFERWMLKLTPILMMLIGAALAAALLVTAAAGAAAPRAATLAAAGALACAILGLIAARGAARRHDPAASLLWAYGGYAAALCLTALVALPMIDRWQDLPQLAARIRDDTAQQRLALLDPDETTLAMLDRGAAPAFAVIRSDDADPRPVVAQWFAAHGATARLLLLLPGHAPGPLSRFLAGFRPLSAPGDGVAAALIGRGAAIMIQRYELPQGRRYALLGPPVPPSPQ